MKLTSLLLLMLFGSCNQPLPEQDELPLESFETTIDESEETLPSQGEQTEEEEEETTNTTPPVEADHLFFHLTIEGVEQKLENSDEFVGCQRGHGSKVLDINVSGDGGNFINKTGRWEMTLPLVHELGDKEFNLFADAYNPIGLPIFDFISDDAPIEYVELPIGIIEVPQVTHTVMGLFNDPSVNPSCSIKAHKRGSVTVDYGRTNNYGIRKQYREFEIVCNNFVSKDQLQNIYLERDLGQVKIHFNCEEMVFY